ncbi:MAG TPA: phage GP46 family protein [Pyrinomonadaceae bacterium]|nr:phage GP46 family protein [Pyrinomonadaceae bacterium]
MSDIATVWDVANSRGDWLLAGAQLATGNDLATAVLISIFTDGEAHADDVIPDGTTDRRGWWGNAGDDKPLVSRLWLLDRSKLTEEVAARARDYIAESLQWMLDDGVAVGIEIATQIVIPNMLGVQVALKKRDGATETMRFGWAWNQVN